MDINWQVDLERWLAPFVAALGHKTRADVPRIRISISWLEISETGQSSLQAIMYFCEARV